MEGNSGRHKASACIGEDKYRNITNIVLGSFLPKISESEQQVPLTGHVADGAAMKISILI